MDSYRAVTSKAQGANILKIAFAAALDDGKDVVRVPESFARSAAQSPVR
jgi:hypothetical protein